MVGKPGGVSGVPQKDFEAGKPVKGPEVGKGHGKAYTTIERGINALTNELRRLGQRIDNMFRGQGFKTDRDAFGPIVGKALAEAVTAEVEGSLKDINSKIEQLGSQLKGTKFSVKEKESLSRDLDKLEKEAERVSSLGREDRYDAIVERVFEQLTEFREKLDSAQIEQPKQEQPTASEPLRPSLGQAKEAPELHRGKEVPSSAEQTRTTLTRGQEATPSNIPKPKKILATPIHKAPTVDKEPTAEAASRIESMRKTRAIGFKREKDMSRYEYEQRKEEMYKDEPKAKGAESVVGKEKSRSSIRELLAQGQKLPSEYAKEDQFDEAARETGLLTEGGVVDQGFETERSFPKPAGKAITREDRPNVSARDVQNAIQQKDRVRVLMREILKDPTLKEMLTDPALKTDADTLNFISHLLGEKHTQEKADVLIKQARGLCEIIGRLVKDEDRVFGLDPEKVRFLSEKFGGVARELAKLEKFDKLAQGLPISKASVDEQVKGARVPVGIEIQKYMKEVISTFSRLSDKPEYRALKIRFQDYQGTEGLEKLQEMTSEELRGLAKDSEERVDRLTRNFYLDPEQMNVDPAPIYSSLEELEDFQKSFLPVGKPSGKTEDDWETTKVKKKLKRFRKTKTSTEDIESDMAVAKGKAAKAELLRTTDIGKLKTKISNTLDSLIQRVEIVDKTSKVFDEEALKVLKSYVKNVKLAFKDDKVSTSRCIELVSLAVDVIRENYEEHGLKMPGPGTTLGSLAAKLGVLCSELRTQASRTSVIEGHEPSDKTEEAPELGADKIKRTKKKKRASKDLETGRPSKGAERFVKDVPVLRDKFYEIIDDEVNFLRGKNPNDPSIALFNAFKHEVKSTLWQKNLTRQTVNALREKMINYFARASMVSPESSEALDSGELEKLIDDVFKS